MPQLKSSRSQQLKLLRATKDSTRRATGASTATFPKPHLASGTCLQPRSRGFPEALFPGEANPTRKKEPVGSCCAAGHTGSCHVGGRRRRPEGEGAGTANCAGADGRRVREAAGKRRGQGACPAPAAGSSLIGRGNARGVSTPPLIRVSSLLGIVVFLRILKSVAHRVRLERLPGAFSPTLPCHAQPALAPAPLRSPDFPPIITQLSSEPLLPADRVGARVFLLPPSHLDPGPGSPSFSGKLVVS